MATKRIDNADLLEAWIYDRIGGGPKFGRRNRVKTPSGEVREAPYGAEKGFPRVTIRGPHPRKLEFTFHASERKVWAPWLSEVALCVCFDAAPFPANVPAPALLWWPIQETVYGWSVKGDEEFQRVRRQNLTLDLVRYEPGKTPVGQGRCRGMVPA